MAQERAQITRQAVLDAAAAVFDEKGFAGAAISGILERAGVTRGAMYFHFRSKEDLAKALIEEQEAWRLGVVLQGSSPLQRLIGLGETFARALQDNAVIRASIRLTLERGTFTVVDAATPYQNWKDAVRELLSQARQAGQLRPGVDVDKAAFSITAAFTGLQLMSEATSQRRDLCARLDDFWACFLVGLATTEAYVSLDLGYSEVAS